eukprot:763100-Hanusia_phi.AAC.18
MDLHLPNFKNDASLAKRFICFSQICQQLTSSWLKDCATVRPPQQPAAHGPLHVCGQDFINHRHLRINRLTTHCTGETEGSYYQRAGQDCAKEAFQ